MDTKNYDDDKCVLEVPHHIRDTVYLGEQKRMENTNEEFLEFAELLLSLLP